MIKDEFEKKLKDVFAEVNISQERENRIIYHVKGKDLHTGRLIITNGGLDGIRACVDRDGRKKGASMFFDWPSVYDWAYGQLCNPADGTQQESAVTYNFMWHPGDDIYGIDDETLEEAMKLKQAGCVHSISYDDGNVILKVRAPRQAVAAEPGTRALQQSDNENPGEDMELREFRLKFDASAVECTRYGNEIHYEYPVCILCGYLDYLDRRGRAQTFLRKRKYLRTQYTKPHGPYSFTWTPKYGLSRLPENQFRLALQIAQSGKFRLDRDLTEKNCVRIHSPQWVSSISPTAPADQETSFAFMAEAVEEQNILFDCEPTNSIDINVTAPLSICDPEDPYICIYNYAAYIRYLQDCGDFEQIKKDRKHYQDHLNELEQQMRDEPVFAFSLPGDQFMDMPDEIFEMAELLQEENYISMFTHIWEDRYCIRYPSALFRYDDMKQMKKDILTGYVSRADNLYYRPPCGRRLDSYNKNKTDIFQEVVMVAGYVDYLRRTGKYMEYKEKRLEKQQNRESEMDEISCEGRTLEHVLAAVENKRDKSLYCVIESEHGCGENSLVNRIAGRLAENGKINSSETEFCSFENMAAYLGYSDSHEGRDNSSYMVYDAFQQNKLYVLDGLKEFLYHCKDVTEDDDSREAHLIELLGRYRQNTYIIVTGEKKYVDAFLNLSSQIHFVFSGNVIKVRNMSAEKMYAVYLNELSDNLKIQTEEDPAFRDRFIQYIDRNREILPLGNRELAEYLANYANDRESLELPDVLNTREPVKDTMKNVVGLENVKRSLGEFQKFVVYRARAEASGMKLPDTRMHMVFTGNPGTGKTTVGRSVADMLHTCGVIKTNKLVEVERKDMIGEYIGQTAQKTDKVIESARGGVLFIDEAYTLTPKSERDFAGEAIATLVKAMEDCRDDLIVIFAGYEKEMQEFLNSNPGLQSRIGYTFHFDDYSTEELVQIFDTKIREAGFTYSGRKEKDKVFAKVSDLCDYFKKGKNFGNARFVDQIIQSTIMARSQRKFTDKSIQKLTAADIPDIRDMASMDVLPEDDFEEKLDEFVGMENVKKQVREFADFVKLRQYAAQAGKKLPGGNMNMLFKGNPGTGKTSMARIMAEMLCSIGVIMTARVVEVNAVELLGQYVGQTAEKTSAVIERAMGGVLFIDEAYALIPSEYNNSRGDAITTLLTAMEDHKDNLIVIFAGYGEEMDRFLDSNPGIRSRIGYTFVFEDYSADQLVRIFDKKLQAAGIEYDGDEVPDRVRELCERFRGEKNFGNGRFVDHLIQRVLIRHAGQNSQDKNGSIILTGDDIPGPEEISESMGARRESGSMVQIGFRKYEPESVSKKLDRCAGKSDPTARP